MGTVYAGQLKAPEPAADNGALSIRARLLLTALIVTFVATGAGTLLVQAHLSATARQRAADDVAAKVALVEMTLADQEAHVERAVQVLAAGPPAHDLARRAARSDVRLFGELQLSRELADVTTLQLLDGIVDVYMPDFKFLDETAADRYLSAPDYPEVVVAGVGKMFGQVGPLQLGPDGTVTSGVLVRHLVMPGHLHDSKRILQHLAERYGADIAVNIMGQYRPCGQVAEFPELSRSLDHSEWVEARRFAQELGLLLA